MTVDSTAISRPRPPDLIPGYKLEKLVGKGGMGEVHRAVQLSLGRVVAVKLLAADLAHDKAFVTRFEKEAAALATLSHPHIVAIVDKGKAKDTYFLVMEFVDGPSLREVMRSPLLDSGGAMKIAVEICRAIDYAHGRGVIHRDLKPENILFDEQAGGIPKVSDFGLAAFVVSEHPKFNVTETHVSMGTLSYMAPEQRVDAKTADHRADIYSLGVIIYELLVGEVPVGNFDSPSQRKPEVDKRLDPIVARCLKPDPSERYQSVSDLLADLEPLAPVSFSLRPRKISRAERMVLNARRALRLATRALAAVMVVAAMLILGTALLRGRSGAPSIPTADALTLELPTKGSLQPPGRITDEPELRSVSLGDGPDTIPLVAWGQLPVFESKSLRFPPPDSKESVARSLLDLSDVDGQQVQFTAEVTTQLGNLSVWTRARNFMTGAVREPRSALMLVGAPGRFAAVVVSGKGEPVSLEWALAEKHAVMLGPTSPAESTTKLELTVDRNGELRGFVGSGKDRRPVGEAINLGQNWRKHFGRMPIPQVVCIEGTCQFRKILYEVRRDPPPPPTAPVAVAQAKTPAAPTKKPPPPKKPAPKPQPLAHKGSKKH